VKCLKKMAFFKVTLLFILSVVWTALADEAADPDPEEIVTVEVKTDGEQTVYPVGDTGLDIKEMEIVFKKKFLDDELEAVYKRYGEIVYELLDEQRIPASTSPDGQEPMLKANGWNTMTQKIVEEQRFARTRIAGIERELRIIEEEFGPIESIHQEQYGGDEGYDFVALQLMFKKRFLDEEWEGLYKRYGEIKEEQRALEMEHAPDFKPQYERKTRTQEADWKVRTQNLREEKRFTSKRLFQIEMELLKLDEQYGPIAFIEQHVKSEYTEGLYDQKRRLPGAGGFTVRFYDGHLKTNLRLKLDFRYFTKKQNPKITVDEWIENWLRDKAAETFGEKSKEWSFLLVKTTDWATVFSFLTNHEMDTTKYTEETINKAFAGRERGNFFIELKEQ